MSTSFDKKINQLLRNTVMRWKIERLEVEALRDGKMYDFSYLNEKYQDSYLSGSEFIATCYALVWKKLKNIRKILKKTLVGQ